MHNQIYIRPFLSYVKSLLQCSKLGRNKLFVTLPPIRRREPMLDPTQACVERCHCAREIRRIVPLPDAHR